MFLARDMPVSAITVCLPVTVVTVISNFKLNLLPSCEMLRPPVGCNFKLKITIDIERPVARKVVYIPLSTTH